MGRVSAVLTSILLFLLICPNSAFSQECFDISQRDNVSDLQAEIERARLSTVRVTVRNFLVLAEAGDPFTPVARDPRHNHGWGVIVKGGSDKLYVMTFLHVIGFNAERTFNKLKEVYPDSYDKYSLYDKEHSIFIKPYGEDRDSIEVNPQPVVAIGDRAIQRENDALVLLELPDDAPDIPAAQLVQGEDCLKPLTDVVFIGSSQSRDDQYGLLGFEVNASSVSSVGHGMYFRLKEQAVSGISGSPVFAYYDDSLRVVGLIRGWNGAMFRGRVVPTYAIGYKVDPILSVLRNY